MQGTDREILKLKPGITGAASIKYRNEEEILALQDDPIRYNNEVIFPDKVKININYLNNRNFWTNLNIIFCTLTGKTPKEDKIL